MPSHAGRKKAIASVVGMLFMALVFLVAIGAQVYISDVQGAASAAQAQAQQRSVLRGQEEFSYGGLPMSLEVTNTGGNTATMVAMLLKLENGTVYDLNGTSTPQFRAQVLPIAGAVGVQPLVPKGTCTPSRWTCVSVYEAITRGGVPGRSIALVTTLGNTFWYDPAASVGSPDPSFFRTTGIESTAATNYTAIPGLVFSGGANTFYSVQIQIGYWQSGPSPNSDMFAIAISNESTFMFCGGMSWSVPTGSSTNLSPGNGCSSVPGRSLGPTWSESNGCNSQQLACEFIGKAYVTFGPAGGTFSMEFEGTGSGDANVFADSVIMATLAQ